MKRLLQPFIAATAFALAASIDVAHADDNPDIGIKYDKKQGLYVTPFSANLLGFVTADVEEKSITEKLTLQAQVFDE